MFLRMGYRGMSSDESDSEGNRFKVHLCPWRHPNVTQWLHAIDALGLAMRKNANLKQGSSQREREPSTKPGDPTRFVRGLPRNSYEPTWLDNPDHIQFDVRPTDEVYNFVHDREVYSYLLAHMQRQ
ncbi:hypothetical protein JR316_0006194 [Psilocybe cubensis]|uniref:Uncharacterized protein n=2 Tax=Psilocybe cubensis TaxID=181762 RepID=A0ACB8H1W5_PSICU|nr:hypothetical protein JR316_0006194 [Psilocybe cubensis]KAH9481667.1 hypothetical protein JR316_0006194 [Psilocybe cubensis]